VSVVNAYSVARSKPNLDYLFTSIQRFVTKFGNSLPTDTHCLRFFHDLVNFICLIWSCVALKRML